MVVTAVGILLARSIWSAGSSFVIALAIFSGQLCVGWTNDLVDLESDAAQGRKNKPLTTGALSEKLVVLSTYIALAFCVALSLFGPMGIRGGLIHLLGVGCGVAYNFFFKRNLLSPVPYVIAFVALPTSILISKTHVVPIWLIFIGGLFGLAAHFSNVVKDMDRDREAGDIGLPQLIGTNASLVIAGLSLVTISIVLSVVSEQRALIPIGITSLFLLFLLPRKYCFPFIMTIALLDVVFLVTYGSASLSRLS